MPSGRWVARIGYRASITANNDCCTATAEVEITETILLAWAIVSPSLKAIANNNYVSLKVSL
jgi:hypothetical protein